MSAKEDLFAAARSLHDEGRESFALTDVVGEARRQGSRYPEVTLRSMVSHHLRIDKKNVLGGVGFFRVSRGLYRLASNNMAVSTGHIIRPVVSTSKERIAESPVRPRVTDTSGSGGQRSSGSCATSC